MFGKNTFEPGTLIFILLLSIRMMHLVVTGYRFSKGQSLYIQHLFETEEERQESNKTARQAGQELCANVLRFFLHGLCYAAVFGLYWNNNRMRDQSLVSKLWVEVELVSGVLEWPFIAWQLYVAIAKQRRIKKLFNKKRNEEEALQEREKRKNVERLQAIANDKRTLEVEEDFFTLTCFSYLKVNADAESGWGIKPEKQSQMFYSTLIVAIVVLSMQFCMLGEMFTK